MWLTRQVVSARDRDAAILLQYDAMWATMEVDRPTVNGVSGYWPRGWGALEQTWVRHRNAATARYLLEGWLRSHGVDPATVQVIVMPPWYRTYDAPPQRPRRKR